MVIHQNNKGDLKMENLNSLLEEYIVFCISHKRLDKKTIKAYRIDIRQFSYYLTLNTL